MKPYVYDPEAVTVPLGDMFLTGYAEDSKIELEKNEDDTIAKVGVGGDVTYTNNHDRTGKAKISLMNSSPCLPRIYEIAAGFESFSFAIIDMNDNGQNIACDDCRIIKRPTKPVKKEAETVEFEVFIPEWK